MNLLVVRSFIYKSSSLTFVKRNATAAGQLVDNLTLGYSISAERIDSKQRGQSEFVVER